MAWFECTSGSSSPTPPTPTSESYIYNVGATGFNTGYKHTADTKIVFKAFVDPFIPNYGQVFGSRSGNYAYSSFGFFGRFNSERYCFFRTGQEMTGDFVTASENSTSSPWYDDCIFTAYKKTISWYRVSDPDTVKSIEATNGNPNAGIAPLGIFCGNNSTSVDGWTPVDTNTRMRLYWFEIYEDDALVHRFIPAYNNSQYCLYDEVDKTYIYDTLSNGSYLRGCIAT
jgi:hypothetical protein